MTKNTNATGWYSNVFASWDSKQLGRKPTAAELAIIHALNARPGKQALANAMALRDSGVTGAQIIIACGAPQLNKMRGFIADGVVKRVPTAPSAEGHQVYKLELTAKGQAKVKAAAEKPATEKPVKAKTAKPRKAKKSKEVVAPVVVTEPATEPVQEVVTA